MYQYLESVHVNRETGPEDVYIRVICCGICHTDIHQIKNDLGASSYPMVPGYVFTFLIIVNSEDHRDIYVIREVFL